MSSAARIGIGNLAGVALAISMGGPGAVFWMWVIAIIGASSSFVESTLAQIYKVKDGSGFRGGPAYYMEKGLNKRWMGIWFSILITVSYGLIFNSVQANTVTLAFKKCIWFRTLYCWDCISCISCSYYFWWCKKYRTYVGNDCSANGAYLYCGSYFRCH